MIFTGVGLGWFSDRYGWDHLFVLMAGVALVGCLLIASLWNIRDDGYLHDDQLEKTKR